MNVSNVKFEPTISNAERIASQAARLLGRRLYITSSYGKRGMGSLTLATLPSWQNRARARHRNNLPKKVLMIWQSPSENLASQLYFENLYGKTRLVFYIGENPGTMSVSQSVTSMERNCEWFIHSVSG